MSKAYEWRDAIEKAKILEQRFELSDGHVVEVAPAGVFIRSLSVRGLEVEVDDARGTAHRIHLEVDDAELVRLGTWLYETFYEEPAEGQEP